MSSRVSSFCPRRHRFLERSCCSWPSNPHFASPSPFRPGHLLSASGLPHWPFSSYSTASAPASGFPPEKPDSDEKLERSTEDQAQLGSDDTATDSQQLTFSHTSSTIPGKNAGDHHTASASVDKNGTRSTESQTPSVDKNSTSSTESQTPSSGALGYWVSMLLMAGTGGALLWYYDRERQREALRQSARVRSVGDTRIGGNFTLVDAATGQLVSRSALMDHYTLLYFGFTACPEICPTELRKLSAVYNRLSARDRESLQMFFVSCDPWRDSVAAVRNYVVRFHPKLRGLTGTPAQVAEICRQYRVYYSKPPRGAEMDTEDADYLVDHSIFFYLMDKDGNLLRYFGQEVLEDELLEELHRELTADRKKHFSSPLDWIKEWWLT